MSLLQSQRPLGLFLGIEKTIGRNYNNRSFPSSKNSHFQNEANKKPLVVNEFYLKKKKKTISISKVEHLTSF